MKKEKLFRALDGLFAFDSGAVGSGIKDDELKAEVFTYLKTQCREFESYPDILTEFVKEHYMTPPYGLEDVKEFINWVEDNNEWVKTEG